MTMVEARGRDFLVGLRKVHWAVVSTTSSTEGVLLSVPSGTRAVILYLEYSNEGADPTTVYIQTDTGSTKYFQWNCASEGGGIVRNLTQCAWCEGDYGEDIVYKQSAAVQLYITVGYVLEAMPTKERT